MKQMRLVYLTYIYIKSLLNSLLCVCVYFEVKIPLLSCRFDYCLTQKICSEIIET